MKQHVRVYFVMVLAQAACLALGLWLETRFVHSLAQHSGDDGASTIEPGTVRDAVEPSPQDEARDSDAASSIEDPATAMRAMAFVWIAALQAVVAYLVLSRLRAESSRKQTRATQESLRRHNDLLRTRDAIIFGLAKLAESRDPETGNHLERIALYSTRLAAALQRRGHHRRRVSPSMVKLIGISSALHDIGKVGIKDSILLKPGKLEVQERFVMQMHSSIGGRCVREIEARLGSSNFLQMAREIAFCHHERWDGTGYPNGMAGEEIPLAARIVAIADVYDALSTRRVYKEAFPHEECVQTIKDEAGGQFDPLLVDVFLQIESEFRDIARRCADAEEPEDSAEEPLEDDAKVLSAGGLPDDDGPSVALPVMEPSTVQSVVPTH